MICYSLRMSLAHIRRQTDELESSKNEGTFLLSNLSEPLSELTVGLFWESCTATSFGLACDFGGKSRRTSGRPSDRQLLAEFRRTLVGHPVGSNASRRMQ